MGYEGPPERDVRAWLRRQARAWEPRLRFAGAWRNDPDRWREELRAELARLLRLAEVAKAEPRIVWQAPTQPHSLTLLEATSPSGLVGRAWLTAPAALERGAPAVLLMPDRRGAEVVVGQAGRDGDEAYDLAGELAGMGIVALVVERVRREAADALQAMGRPLMGLDAAAGLAWLRYLRERPDVDGRHAGVVGLGEGSRAAMLVACFEACPAVALCGGWEPWLPVIRAGEFLDEAAELPGLLEIADWTDLMMIAWSGGCTSRRRRGRSWRGCWARRRIC